MTSKEIRQKFLKFFEEKEHKIIPSASLVPENDPSVLFNTAGMQPLVPYLLGEKHPKGDKLVNVQKCLRTKDIDSVGDSTHLTFFEMLGNWSLGSYFKEEAIKWSYELLTDKEKGFGLNPDRLYVTVFEGDENAPIDKESAEIWKSVGIPEHRIYYMPASSNWWQPGENGPCGPDTEMYYDITDKGLGNLSKDEFLSADSRQDVVEIWNDVFMEYKKVDGKVVGKLDQKNVDTGAGLERLAVVLQNKESVYETDLFDGLINTAKTLSKDERSQKILADHLRSACFLNADGVLPSNTDQGYVLRRLIRRAILKTDERSLNETAIDSILEFLTDKYGGHYEEINNKKQEIKNSLMNENEKFSQTLANGLKQFEKMSESGIDGKEAFVLFSTYGFPFEVTQELAKEKGVEINENEFKEELNKHKDLSRTATEGKFKGGLGGHGQQEIRYHTATHLLNAALRKVLGDHVEQRGSNITSERLRFDFSHSQKLTDNEKQKVEELVNDWIREGLETNCEEMSLEKAREAKAMGVFGEKYGDQVKVYSIGDISKEICGGPHVKNTNELGEFKIKKEEASSQGVRRIKALLQ